MHAAAVRPSRDEAAPYYFGYIDLVNDGDVRATLEQQRAETVAWLRTVPQDRVSYRYAPDKWSVSGVLAHMNDCERMFAFRAFWFARGFESALPSFDQMVAAKYDAADTRSWESLVDEFDTLRRASMQLFSNLPEEAWLRRGIASDNPFSVRALAYVAAGHVIHHTKGLRQKYLQHH